MSLTTLVNRVTYTGAGIAGPFAIPFKFLVNGDIKIVKTLKATGVGVTLAEGADYTLTGAGVAGGGSVTLTVAIDATYGLTIYRDPQQDQQTQFPPNDKFPSAANETALDKLTMLVQRAYDFLNRTVRFADSDVSGASPTLPTPVAGSVLGWAGDGLSIVNYLQAGLVAVSAYGLTLLNAANKAAAQLILGFNRNSLWCGNAAGTANAIALTSGANLAALSAGDEFVWKATLTSNAAVTIAVDAVAAKAAQVDGAAMVAGEIQTGKWYRSTYDGAAFQTERVMWLGAQFTAKGDVMTGTGAGLSSKLAAGTDNQALLADSTAANGLRYVTLGAGSVRQSVQQGVQDANGYAAMLTVGAGLRPGLSATAKACVIAFAAGFGQAGAQDFVSTLSADVADPLGADLKASNTAYLHATYTSPAAVAWAACYVPPDYGYAFDRTRGALLNFEGINGAAATTDDFGNTWTLTGATISTAQFKFGASSLDCTGGGAKSASSANFTTMGDGSWEASIWFRIGALPGVGTEAALISFVNASGFGMTARLHNTAGTTTTIIYLSGDGTTWSIANGSTGANTVWALNQWNKMRVVFDALAGTYRIYLSLNGAAETQDFSVSSSSRINGVSQCKLAQDAVGTSQFNGYLDAFRFIRAATNTTTEVPAAVAPAIGDYPYHWFSIPDMKMYEATAASGAAGVNPTLTPKNRCFVAEADTSGAAVTAVRNYALRGQYLKEGIAPANDTVTAFSDNLGTKVKRITAWAECFTNENNEVVGNRTELRGDGNAGTGGAYRGSTTLITGPNTVRLVTSINPVIIQNQGSTSAFVSQTNGNYKIGLRVERAF